MFHLLHSMQHITFELLPVIFCFVTCLLLFVWDHMCPCVANIGQYLQFFFLKRSGRSVWTVLHPYHLLYCNLFWLSPDDLQGTSLLLNISLVFFERPRMSQFLFMTSVRLSLQGLNVYHVHIIIKKNPIVTQINFCERKEFEQLFSLWTPSYRPNDHSPHSWGT